MSLTDNYGKSPDNPVLLNSVTVSKLYLDNLISKEGLHLVYHRQGSMVARKGIIDHYEIMVSNNVYDDIFISIHNDNNVWIPPSGYLFDATQDGLLDQLMCRQDVTAQDEDDIMSIDGKYIFMPDLVGGPEFYLAVDEDDPPLESYVHFSFGTNGRIKNFPYSLLQVLPYEVDTLQEKSLQEIVSAIVPRGKRPGFFKDSMV